MLMGISTDWLYPADDIQALASRIENEGKAVTYTAMTSPDGHDAFLKEWDLMTAYVGPFIDQALAEVERP